MLDIACLVRLMPNLDMVGVGVKRRGTGHFIADAASNLYAEQFFRIPERNFFLGVTGQIHCPKPVGLLLHVGKRVIGCKHHPIYTDVLQQKMKQATAGECAGCEPEIVSEVLPDRLF
jgi:hypothetical protein